MHRLLCLLMGFALPGVLSAKESKKDRPNFVVILCDDLGYGDLACYGHPHIKTPHLDKLATQGMRLTSCYAAAPVCSPSRAGMLTGRTPNRSGVYNWIPGNHVMHLRKDEVTVAAMLKNSGYDTAHVGKWHCNGKFNSPAQPQPGDHGFNHWFATQNNAAPSHENPRNFVRNGKPVGPMEGYACQLVADEGVDWLRNGRDKQKPFFLFTCFHEPHEPVASPDKMTAGYSEVARNKLEAEYFANVENMDAAVGKLMAALDELKLADNTLVFFTSDNGPETLRRYGGAARSFGSPGPLRGMKLWLYEGGIRVPFLARWPARLPAGETFDAPVHHFDMYATAAAAAGADLPTDRVMDGVDLTAYVTGIDTTQAPHEYLFFRSGAAQAVRDERWKLMVSAPEGQPRKEWLFDLTAEGEWQDLLAEQPDVAVRLRQALEGHNAEQQPSRWPWVSTIAYNVDRDLSQEDEPDDEFAYWSN